MKAGDMDRVSEIHLAAEKAADTAGAVSVYTDDVEHDVVGFPDGPVHGKNGAQHFYDYLTQQIHTEEMQPIHSYYGEDFCVVEHMLTGTVPGTFFGIPGHGRRISHRLLHILEFPVCRPIRQNVWVHGGSVETPLTASTNP